jgi:predicted ATPase
MIASMRFQNFKALRDAILPLNRFTLIVGPNGSGKSSVLQALVAFKASHTAAQEFFRFVTAGQPQDGSAGVRVTLNWDKPIEGVVATHTWHPSGLQGLQLSGTSNQDVVRRERAKLERIRVYSLDSDALANPVSLQPNMELDFKGNNLAGVLDRLRDGHPERFDALNAELGRWLPEYDLLLFETPGQGQRSIALRTRDGSHPIPAKELSQGTLLSVAILTLAYLPDPPPILGLEEPDRGIHPRLLRDVRDALYRLSYPESFGETREPVQVVATTHSPYFLDLFRDRPEEIVIAQKVGSDVHFERLADQPDIGEILQDTHLGEAWYTGILGGVPASL